MAVSDQHPVLVTGGTGLLGEAIAERFVDAGKQVIVTSRNISRVDDFCAEKTRSMTPNDGYRWR